MSELSLLQKKIEVYCAYQERCQQEVITKLYELKADTSQVNELIINLISANFVNEERFAISYVRGKVNIKKWGKTKIRMMLKSKKISEVCIRKAILQIDEDLYLTNLQNHLLKYWKPKNALAIQKAIKYAYAKGYEYDLIKDALVILSADN